MNGVVRTLVVDKKYGFIRTAQSVDYFFHRDDFEGHWEDLVIDFKNPKFGDIEVKFIDATENKGPRASQVRRIDFPNG